MIEYISTDKIFPHPDNPRKDLGDLRELKDSIKANGILQNLTIVPFVDENGDSVEDKFTVVIGHRRLAAARLAGLEEVPCVVSDMDMRTQLATMLLENIQRSDLTMYEQAQGFQLMLDFGETAASIATLTGFSKQTVKRRIALLKLDGEELQKADSRGGTLEDYAKLEEIKNIEARNRVLEYIGTNNFQWALKDALTRQAEAKNRAAAIKYAKTFATEFDGTRDNVAYVKTAWYKDGLYFKPEDYETVKYFYEVSDYSLTIFRERTAEEVTASNEKREAERTEIEERRVQLKEKSETAYNLRYDFIKDFPQSEAKKKSAVIMGFMIKEIIESNYHSTQRMNKQIAEMLGIEAVEGEEKPFFDMVKEKIAKQYERALLVSLYCSLGDSAQDNYYGWNADHAVDEDLDALYDFLTALGYEMSDEEVQLRDGTHELFQKPEENAEENAEEAAEEVVDEAAEEAVEVPAIETAEEFSDKSFEESGDESEAA
jgi:ParB family chromosome partitioning protein